MLTERGVLLETMTTLHPAIQALNSQIAQAQNQLAAVPAELGGKPMQHQDTQNRTLRQRPSDSELMDVAIADGSSSSESRSTESQREYRNLLMAAGHARDQFQTAVTAENAAWDARQRCEFLRIETKAGSLDLRPDQTVRQLRAADRLCPIGAITLLMLFSLTAGTLASRCIDRRMLLSASGVEASLTLAAVGQFRSGIDRPTDSAA
jgi:hypothetical protein